jgi:hypothetical protein
MFAKTNTEKRPKLPKGGLHNRWEGREDSWQLHETIDDFISRLPVLGSSWVGPWLWVANPYADRDAEPEMRHAEFMELAPQLLLDYKNEKLQVTENNPNTAQGVINRKLKPARDKLKEDILSLAKDKGMTSGKWMLFPTDEAAPGIWKRVATAVVEGNLGTGAKIATDSSTRLVCVYTKDFSDEADIKRVVQQLKNLNLLPSKETNKSIYYKCDAYTYLDIGAGNEYGLQASLYNSKDVLAEETNSQSSAKKTQRRIAGFDAPSKAVDKRKKV